MQDTRRTSDLVLHAPVKMLYAAGAGCLSTSNRLGVRSEPVVDVRTAEALVGNAQGLKEECQGMSTDPRCKGTETAKQQVFG